MRQGRTQINLVKLAIYVLKRCWLIILCAAIGFGAMYYRANSRRVDTYTAFGTMYVYNGNPNMVNYQYTNTTDLASAVKLLDTYMVVVKSNKVMDAVVERLSPDYPGINGGYISATLSMSPVGETGVLRVQCTTGDPQQSADICNAVLDVAPAEIIRVVNAGGIEIIDYATAPFFPDARSPMRNAMIGGLAGAVVAAALLVLLFLLNRKVTDVDDLTANYTPPVLTSVKRYRGKNDDPGEFLLNDKSSMETVESYAKLRMNLTYTLVNKKSHAVVVTSAISGEGKSTIAANLAVSCAMSGKHVVLVDADMRRGCQQDIFHYEPELPGLSDVLVGTASWRDVVKGTDNSLLDVFPAGHLPPNPAELLESSTMRDLLTELEDAYDLVLLDVPPINIVSDPLALSSVTAGALFVVRQNYSDHREIRQALVTAEMTGTEILGFVFHGEKLSHGSYISRRHYTNYYHKYDNRGEVFPVPNQESDQNGKSEKGHQPSTVKQ